MTKNVEQHVPGHIEMIGENGNLTVQLADTLGARLLKA
jgi:hypothetical protein